MILAARRGLRLLLADSLHEERRFQSAETTYRECHKSSIPAAPFADAGLR
jgi:hypothetical protein